jgi:hypothetical protein
MKRSAPLEQLARAMLVGASFGCKQVQTNYWSVLGVNSDGSFEYGFCAIGCANVGLLGRVPHNIALEVHRLGAHFMGREPLERALGVNWDMLVPLPDGSQAPLLRAVSGLNDKERWTVARIAAWLLMLSAGWTVREGSLRGSAARGEEFVLGTGGFIEVIAALEAAHWREPEYESWRRIVDPAWWVERFKNPRETL